jgi:hypothetical protein
MIADVVAAIGIAPQPAAIEMRSTNPPLFHGTFESLAPHNLKNLRQRERRTHR